MRRKASRVATVRGRHWHSVCGNEGSWCAARLIGWRRTCISQVAADHDESSFPASPEDPGQSRAKRATTSERWPGALSLAIIARLPLAITTRLGVMTSSAEDCWRLSGDCSRWAMESGDSAARLAFRQMATAWARLAFSEEFAFPAADEHVDPTSSETSEPIPAENATSSPVVPPPTVSETGTADSNHAAEVDVGNYDHTTHASPDKTPDLSWQHKRLSLRSRISFPKR